MKKDLNAWTAGVELQQIRDRIIFYLLDLKDFEYQKREWLKAGCFDIEFDYQIYSAVEFILEDLVLERDIISDTIYQRGYSFV